MYQPSLALLRWAVSPAIRAATARPIKESSSPATIYRVDLEVKGDQAPETVIIKRTRRDWPGDPLGHERESRFYGSILPKLDIPHAQVYFTGPEPGTANHVVIMADLSASHHFPPPAHTWTNDEVGQILRAYARLHGGGYDSLPDLAERKWMMDRHEKRLYETADRLPEMVESLTGQGIWPAMPAFGRLLERTMDEANRLLDEPVTVLHNDVYPPNCGIPIDDSSEVVLLDWEMVGWGLAEMDLGYMFLQPFGSHRQLDKTSALGLYWDERRRLSAKNPSGLPQSEKEREFRQRYADALWAIWLIPVAFKMAASPFPQGTPPRAYWDSMFSVLGERLLSLGHEI